MVDEEKINKDFEIQIDSLRRQMSDLDNRLNSLQTHIITMETINQHLEQLARTESDGVKRSKYFQAIRNNLELIALLYRTYNEFITSKYRYHKELDDVILAKYRLIEVEIRRLNDLSRKGLSEGLDDFLRVLTNLLNRSTTNEKIQEVTKIEDPDYQL